MVMCIEKGKGGTQKDDFLLTAAVKVPYNEVREEEKGRSKKGKKEVESRNESDSVTVWHLTGSMDKYKQYIGGLGMHV